MPDAFWCRWGSRQSCDRLLPISTGQAYRRASTALPISTKSQSTTRPSRSRPRAGCKPCMRPWRRPRARWHPSRTDNLAATVASPSSAMAAPVAAMAPIAAMAPTAAMGEEGFQGKQGLQGKKEKKGKKVTVTKKGKKEKKGKKGETAIRRRRRHHCLHVTPVAARRRRAATVTYDACNHRQRLQP